MARKADDVPGDDAGAPLSDKDWTRLFRDALKAASSFQEAKLRSAWSRNYRAFHNRHMSGSKYDSFRFRHRSKLFKPKTRMAVRKNDATAASAMFSTADVVMVAPERASDRVQQMTARFINACLNYRLDRATRMTGPNWFMTAIGARQDAQLTGICVSKQYWEYEERDREVVIEAPAIDANGMPLTDPATGLGLIEERIESERETCRDRLMITLIAPELAFIDPTADWRDPVQEGSYFIAAYPTREDDLKAMISADASRPRLGGGAWRGDIDIERVLARGRSGERRRNQAVRRAREDGIDRYESRHADDDGEVVWLYECFHRREGEDWHFWMLGETILLSDPRPTREAYPEQKGERPYAMGVGALESHKTHPTAPVESWQPLQQELNEVTNLALDARKMAISPITKIRRGRNIDFKQVQNRGPDAMVMVEEADDVTFERAPSPDGGEQLVLNTLNVDFDELAGVFSTGSVQTNRLLNETVGGMQMLAGTSNALTEFDLRVWVETWVEPCLRQCVRAIQHYESSETVIALAGEKAGLIMVAPEPEGAVGPGMAAMPGPGMPGAAMAGLGMPGPGMQAQGMVGPGMAGPGMAGMPVAGPGDGAPQHPHEGEKSEPPVTLAQVLDSLDDAAVSVKVSVGIGALDPRQKLEKFMGGVKMTLEMLPLLAAAGVMPDAPQMMNEGWGLLGYKDAERFFRPKPRDDGPPPEMQKLMLGMKLEMERAKQEAAARQQDMMIKQEEHRLAMAKMMEEFRQARVRFAGEMQREMASVGAAPHLPAGILSP